jgi:hypothetical protein
MILGELASSRVTITHQLRAATKHHVKCRHIGDAQIRFVSFRSAFKWKLADVESANYGVRGAHHFDQEPFNVSRSQIKGVVKQLGR